MRIIHDDRFWPFSEVFNFPKEDVQAAAIGKSCLSGRAAAPDPFWPLRLGQGAKIYEEVKIRQVGQVPR